MITRLLCSILFGCGLVSPVPAQTARHIAPDVWLIPGEFVPGRQPDGNSVLLRTPEGLIVIDSGRHAAHADAILAQARALELPVAVLLNTHWHLDHVGGNPALRAAYPALRVLASDAIDEALRGFLAESRRQLEQMLTRPADAASKQAWREEIARIDAGPQLRPDEVIAVGATRILAGREVVLGLETDAVSGGDVWLFDPASRVLVAGDLVTLPAPFLDTACAPRWREALARVDAIDFQLLVPGHGAPMARAEFGLWRSAFDQLLECAEATPGADACVDGWLAGVAPLLADTPVAFTRDLTRYYVQQRLRGEGATRDCPAG